MVGGADRSGDQYRHPVLFRPGNEWVLSRVLLSGGDGPALPGLWPASSDSSAVARASRGSSAAESSFCPVFTCDRLVHPALLAPWKADTRDPPVGVAVDILCAGVDVYRRTEYPGIRMALSMNANLGNNILGSPG